ncbi:MAG: c-type cytochrome biogenesis protein CcmI/CycH [Elusimicrobiales bacterium]
MLKRVFWLGLAAAAVFAAWRYGYPIALRSLFRISGTVSVAGPLLPSLPGPNSMLFVVAVNEGGVPVAVKKIINPVFPAEFEMTSSSLIMPDLLTRKVYLEAVLNTHGQLGAPRRGGLKGSFRERVSIRQKDLDLTLDSPEK